MAFVEWSPSLDTGISVIDSQHRRIVDYINQLHRAIQSKDFPLIGDAIDQLIDYTVGHFAFEEHLFDVTDYAEADKHRASHVAFTVRIEDYQARFEKGENVGLLLITELREWLFNHIKHDDWNYLTSIKPLLRQADKGWLSDTLDRYFRG